MSSPRDAVLAQSVCFGYTAQDVLHNVSVRLPFGEVTVLAGPNGSGKSTLLELLAGVRVPRSGRVIRSAEVALVVQRPDAPDTLPVTVADTVAMGTWRRPRAGYRPRPTRASRRAAIAQAIERVGLAGLEGRPFADLSGGQRQRALIAQALVGRPGILLLDEPAAGLDHRSREITQALLAEEARRGAAVGCVTHDDAAIAAADRVVHLRDGRIMSAAPDDDAPRNKQRLAAGL
ncbi:zinc ABC transporter ATP-binding protein AztA [Microbacterium stercoris]|uniref:zinc ABC transporter ATP-binding protein AztA n=1 Tax=Microbacterium stercoris TaxID=2820289 RepID=UPI0027DBDB30|nr:zinc ABC transporter ATP-binding protein AztA [Microbacterium stercoris]